MRTSMQRLGLIALLLSVPASVAFGWGRGGGGFRGGGFGGFRAGGVSAFHAGGYGGFHSASFGGYREGGFDRGSFSGSRSFASGWGDRGLGAAGSYDRSWSGDRGGSVNVSGARGAAVGSGGAVAGRTRDVTATGPEGRTYSSASRAGAAIGPGGAIAGGSRAGLATGPRGAVAGASRWGDAATRFPTDAGFARYSTGAIGDFARPTAFWSNSYMADRAAFVRGGFYNYGAFYPGWHAANPLAWTAAGWAAGAAWTAATWPVTASFLSIPVSPINYDYGNTIVYQNNIVYDNGEDVGTTQQYAQQASTIAQKGQEAKPAPSDKWQPLGVFALVQGEEKTSNTLFQLAVNPEGIIRGNYYDGLMQTTSPVYGAVDKKTQLAVWTIGDKKEPVFEAGIVNLTRDETPVLVHFGPDKTQQWLLVRMNHKDAPAAPPATAAAAAAPAAVTTEPATSEATAQVTVNVPADADVFFDGTPTTQTGTQRVFATPELPVGKEFSYDIEAQWTANGQAFDQTRKVLVKAGAKVQVDFQSPAP
jgi:uncharacterized protein (TIGR03000 family)